jgi:hypothetical protein
MQASAEISSRILHAWRNTLKKLPLDQPMALEIAQLFGKHALTNARNQPAEFTESLGSLHYQCVHDGRPPTAPNQPHSRLDTLD